MTVRSFDRECYALLKIAVEALAGICDGAETRDDQGFDGGDTKAGHLLAFLPLDAWPLSAFQRAWKWTKKYQRQLELMHIDCTQLPEPPRFEGEDRQIALLPSGQGWYVTFPYDPVLIEGFRCIPGSARHTQPIGRGKQVFHYRTVMAVKGAGAGLLAFAEQFGFSLGSGVADLAQQPGEVILAEVAQEYRVVLEQGRAFALYFPRDASLNAEVKAIAGKVPSYIGGFHWVIPATRPAAAALQAFLERHQQFAVPPEVEDVLAMLAR